MANRSGDVDWTEEMVARFRALHESREVSFAAMAEQLSEEFHVKLTKNAMIGKGRRLGLPKRPRAEPSVRPPKSPKPFRPAWRAWDVEVPTTPVAAPSAGLATIYQLDSTNCHFPYGERPPYAYCGAPAAAGTAWCDHHKALVFAKHWR